MLHANDSFNSKLVKLEELVGLCIRTPLNLMVTVGDNTQVLVSSLPDRLFQLFYKFISPALPPEYGVIYLHGEFIHCEASDQTRDIS